MTPPSSLSSSTGAPLIRFARSGVYLEVADDLERGVRGVGALHPHLDRHPVRGPERLLLDVLGGGLRTDAREGQAREEREGRERLREKRSHGGCLQWSVQGGDSSLDARTCSRSRR